MGGGFPKEPSAYELMETYTASQTFSAPEDGYFQIEVFGASGNGGSGVYMFSSYAKCSYDITGGGGGGGGYACSRVMMKKGDTAVFVCGASGAVSSAEINSSVKNYEKLSVTSGASGGNANGAFTPWLTMEPGYGGSGGVASGGNYLNKNGGYGGGGSTAVNENSVSGASASSGASGAAGYSGGNVGGIGGNGSYSYSNREITTVGGGAGSSGFIRVWRGDTN